MSTNVNQPPPDPVYSKPLPGVCPGHDWETSNAWGVVIGLSRCKKCGKLATHADFPAVPSHNRST